jgi:histidine triad (HIT) family protein
MNCPFCKIVAGDAPASMVHADADVLAFMTIHPTAAGECLVIPKAHIDHFTDVRDELAAHIMIVAQHIGRRMREVFRPDRVGFVVHGFGVPHAHLIVVPQHGPHHITSERFAHVEDGRVSFNMSAIPAVERDVLDKQAQLLATPELGIPIP